jgi:hypothetical protein
MVRFWNECPFLIFCWCTVHTSSTKSNSSGELHSILKLDEEKSKHAGLAEQNGFAQHFFRGC